MKFKFLATAAAVVASVTSAGAADLNKPAKVAVDYVKVCDAYGAGFFYIPGSDTCLKITGYVYTGFEYGTSNTVARTSATAATFAGSLVQGQRSQTAWDNYTRADEQFDARTNTEYGLLRSWINFHEDVGTSGGNAAATTVRLDRAFVQFGGLTAGRALSFYNFYLSDTFGQNYGVISSESPINLLAYTFSFGNGVSATVSLEDPTTGGYDATNAAATNYINRRSGSTFVYGGLNAPDVVANLNVTQAWGSAQLSGGLHQDYGNAASPATKWGYGVQAGVKLNVPTLGAGDTVGLQAAYAVGAIGYTDWQSAYYYKNPAGAFTDLGADASWSAATGIKQTKSFSVFGGLTHNFSPNYELDLSAGYLGVTGYNQTTLNNANSFGQYEFAVDLQWKPAVGVQISPYTEFRSVNFTNSTYNAYGLASKNATTVNYGLRVRRDF